MRLQSNIIGNRSHFSDLLSVFLQFMLRVSDVQSDYTDQQPAKTGRNHGIRKNTGAKKRLGVTIKKLEKNSRLKNQEQKSLPNSFLL